MSRRKAKKQPTGPYEVGYCRPPEAGRFKKGQSGNRKGRPPKKAPPADATAILEGPVTVKVNGISYQMSAFEAGLRKLISRAVKDRSLAAALEVLAIFERYGAIKPPQAVIYGGGVLRVPRHWDRDEWHAMVKTYGPPPWPGERSGLPHDRTQEPKGGDK